MVKRYSKNTRSPGLVNGILRALARNIDRLPTIPETDPVYYLSVRYSHPEWLVRFFLERLGIEGAEQLLAADNGEPATVLQVNTLRKEPEELLERIIPGKIKAILKEVCLVDQKFVKNSDMTVAQYVESVAKEIGKPMTVVEMVRYEVGEGIEKKEEDFAAEVAAQQAAAAKK